MKVDQLVPAVETRFEFSLKNRKFIPQVAGCYALCTFEGDVLYVGLTDNLHRRFSEHRETAEKREPTAQGMAFWFYFLECAKESDLRLIERSWLSEYRELHDGKRPVLNKAESPVR